MKYHVTKVNSTTALNSVPVFGSSSASVKSSDSILKFCPADEAAMKAKSESTFQAVIPSATLTVSADSVNRIMVLHGCFLLCSTGVGFCRDAVDRQLI